MGQSNRPRPLRRVGAVVIMLAVCAASIGWARSSDTAPIKIPIRFARADLITVAFGGSVADPQPGVTDQFAFDTPLQSLLPEGIDSVIAYNRDNTLLVRGTDGGISQFKKVVQQLDVPARQVRLAVALRVTITDQQGHEHTGSFDADASAISGETLMFRTQRQGVTPLPHETPALMKGSEVVVRPDVASNGNVVLTARCTVRYDLSNAKPGSGLSLSGEYSGSTVTKPSCEAVIVRATEKISSCTAKVELKITPRAFTGSPP